MGAVHPVEDILLHPVYWTAALPATLRQIGVTDFLSHEIRSQLVSTSSPTARCA